MSCRPARAGRPRRARGRVAGGCLPVSATTPGSSIRLGPYASWSRPLKSPRKPGAVHPDFDEYRRLLRKRGIEPSPGLGAGLGFPALSPVWASICELRASISPVVRNAPVPGTPPLRIRRHRAARRGRYAEAARPSRAANAAPRAPAMSRSGTSAKAAARACSSRSTVCARTRPRNHSRKRGAVSTTPPPTK